MAGSETLWELVEPNVEDYVIKDDMDIEHDQSELDRAQVERLQVETRFEELQLDGHDTN